MRNIIKKILREGDWDFVTDFEPSEEVLHGAREINKGYYWSIDNYEDWKNLYQNLESIHKLNPKWIIVPSVGNKYREETAQEWFKRYLMDNGNLNLFLPYERNNIYAWFDNMPESFDKNDDSVQIPNLD